MLRMLLVNEIQRRGISYREAAKQIGIAHTTLYAIKKGRALEIDTATLVCNWLGVPVTTMIDPETITVDTNVINAITTILKAAPELEQVFILAAEGVQDGTLTPADFADIVEFAAYKINRRKEQAVKEKSANEEKRTHKKSGSNPQPDTSDSLTEDREDTTDKVAH